jgi:hypothetical protein
MQGNENVYYNGIKVMSLVALVNDGDKINIKRESTVLFMYKGGGDSLLSSDLQIIINNFRKATN